MFIFNISEGIKNRLQLLTKRRPTAECNTTTANMGCMYTGNDINPPAGIMPEDYLMDILDSKEGRAYLQKICPGAKYNPWNDSYCIAWAVNKAVGKEVCKVGKVTLQEMIFFIISGGAVGIGGGFVSGGTSGHFVCVVGVVTDQDLSGVNSPADIDVSQVQKIIIDDPYGDFLNHYRNQNGNDLQIPVTEFVKLTFGSEKKKTMQFYSRVA